MGNLPLPINQTYNAEEDIAIFITATDGSTALQGRSVGTGRDGGSGTGVSGTSDVGVGVQGDSGSGAGVFGTSNTQSGVLGISKQWDGVHGESQSAAHAGVSGISNAGGFGVWGSSTTGLAASFQGAQGVDAVATTGIGVAGSGPIFGVSGISVNIGVKGHSQKFVAVYGFAGDAGQGGDDPRALSPGASQIGVYGRGSPLVAGPPGTPIGVFGISDAALGQGVAGVGYANSGASGVVGISTVGYGVHGQSDPAHSYAGYFVGKVHVTGLLEKAGGGFKIDHPVDPANKYLCHSFVESPEMKNVYDGCATLDAKGEATVTLPRWFEALNKDYRYQLTAIGGPAPNLHVAQEILNAQFKIAGGEPRMQVCWQVTGVRNDRWATSHPISVEEAKLMQERDYYLHPEEYNQPQERGIEWARHPARAKLIQEMMTTGPHSKGDQAKATSAG